MPLVETSVEPLEAGVEYTYVLLTETRDLTHGDRTVIRVCGVFKDLSDANGAAKQMCMNWPEWKELTAEGKYRNFGTINRDADETLFLSKAGTQEWRRINGGLRIYIKSINAGHCEKIHVSVVPQALQPSRKQRSELRKLQEADNYEASKEVAPSPQLLGQVEANIPRKRARYFGDSEWYRDERELLRGDLAPGVICHSTSQASL